MDDRNVALIPPRSDPTLCIGHGVVVALTLALCGCGRGDDPRSKTTQPSGRATASARAVSATWELVVDGEKQSFSASDVTVPQLLTDLVPDDTRGYRNWQQFTLFSGIGRARMTVSKPGQDTRQKRPVVHVDSQGRIVISMVPQRQLDAWIAGGKKEHPRVKSFVDVVSVNIITVPAQPKEPTRVIVHDVDGSERQVTVARVKPTPDPSKGRTRHGGKTYHLRDVIAAGRAQQQPFRSVEIASSKETYAVDREVLSDPRYAVLLKDSQRRSLDFRHLELPAGLSADEDADDVGRRKNRPPKDPAHRPKRLKKLVDVISVRLLP